MPKVVTEFYEPFLQGVNTKVTDQLKKQGEVREAINVSLAEVGKIKKRTGYIQEGDTLEASKEVLGLTPYYPSTGSKYLIAVTNNSADDSAVIKYRTTQNYNFTIETISGANDCLFSFATFIDYLFGVGYNPTTGSLLTTFSISNALAYSTTTNVTNAPKGKYICALHGFLLIANGTDSDNNSSSSRVWWANPPTVIPYSADWNTEDNWWDFQPYDGDEITGIIPMSANRALVFKNRSIHAFEPVAETSVRISGDIGCVAPRTIQNVGSYVLFLGQGGVYATNGSRPSLISNAVEAYIDGINWDNVLTFSAGVDKNRYYHLFIGNLTSPATLSNVELVYDISQNQWTVNTLYNPVRVYANYVEESATTSTSTSSSSTSTSTTTT